MAAANNHDRKFIKKALPPLGDYLRLSTNLVDFKTKSQNLPLSYRVVLLENSLPDRVRNATSPAIADPLFGTSVIGHQHPVSTLAQRLSHTTSNTTDLRGNAVTGHTWPPSAQPTRNVFGLGGVFAPSSALGHPTGASTALSDQQPAFAFGRFAPNSSNHGSQHQQSAFVFSQPAQSFLAVTNPSVTSTSGPRNANVNPSDSHNTTAAAPDSSFHGLGGFHSHHGNPEAHSPGTQNHFFRAHAGADSRPFAYSQTSFARDACSCNRLSMSFEWLSHPEAAKDFIRQVRALEGSSSA